MVYKGPKRGKLGSGKSPKKSGMRAEKKISKKLDGKLTPASGAIDSYKGDISVKGFLLDSKFTGKKSMILSLTQISKICREASGENKKPGLVISFDETPFGVPKEWVLISIEDFKDVIG